MHVLIWQFAKAIFISIENKVHLLSSFKLHFILYYVSVKSTKSEFWMTMFSAGHGIGWYHAIKPQILMLSED